MEQQDINVGGQNLTRFDTIEMLEVKLTSSIYHWRTLLIRYNDGINFNGSMNSYGEIHFDI